MMNASAHLQPADTADLPLVTDLQSPPWREAFLAGLPFLLGALSAVFSALEESSSTGLLASAASKLDTSIFIILLASSVLVTLYALFRRFPLWTASWYSFAAWTAVVLIGLSGVNQDGSNGYFVLVAFGLIILGYLLIFRFSRLHALLVALFLLPVASQAVLEYIPAAWEATLAIVFGVLAALVAAFVLRRWEWQTGVALAIGANLLAGLLLVYVSFTQIEIFGFYGDSLNDAISAFAVYAAATFVIFLGPWLLWRLWDRLTLRRSIP
jgi:hypothetical protein